jgi:hypothetical protein
LPNKQLSLEKLLAKAFRASPQRPLCGLVQASGFAYQHH